MEQELSAAMSGLIVKKMAVNGCGTHHRCTKLSLIVFSNIREGHWYRAYGQLKTSHNARYIQINQMKPILNFDEFSYHLLATVNLHLKSVAKVSSTHQPTKCVLETNGFSDLSPIQQSVREIYSQCKSDSGLHVNSVVQCLRNKFAEGEIRKTVLWLLNEGYLYQTIDNDHAKSTD